MAINASKKATSPTASLTTASITGLDMQDLATTCRIRLIASDTMDNGMGNSMGDGMGDTMGDGIDWWHSGETAIPYDPALALMETQAQAIRAGSAHETIWLLEHQPVYTGGRTAQPNDLPPPPTNLHAGIPIRHSNRGGQWTYHAPGQRVVYIMLDVLKYGRDVRAFVRGIEAWGIATLAQFGIRGVLRPGLPGIWVENHSQARMDKIIAIGIRLTGWVSWHGMAINVRPEVLAGFAGIVPCGVVDGGVTCMGDLISHNDNDDDNGDDDGDDDDTTPLMQKLDTALMASFADSLGRLASRP